MRTLFCVILSNLSYYGLFYPRTFLNILGYSTLGYFRLFYLMLFFTIVHYFTLSYFWLFLVISSYSTQCCTLSYSTRGLNYSIQGYSTLSHSIQGYVMPVCTASYVMAGYGHAHHVF
jgi:hypothetical protein